MVTGSTIEEARVWDSESNMFFPKKIKSTKPIEMCVYQRNVGTLMWCSLCLRFSKDTISTTVGSPDFHR